MFIKCKKQDLINGLNIILKGIPKIPINLTTETVLIIAKNNELNLMINNLNFAIKISSIPSQIIEDGFALLKTKELFDIIKNFGKDEIIEILTDKFFVTNIENGKVKFKILGIDPNKFNKVNFVENEKITSANFETFKNMIKKAKLTVSKDSSLSILNDILFKIKNGYLSIISADGYRGMLNKIEVDTKDNYEFIVPIDTLNSIIEITPSKKDCLINFYLSNEFIMFEIDNCRIVSNLVDGEFLNLESKFYDEYETVIKINCKDFLNSLKKGKLKMPNGKISPIRLKVLNDNKIIVSSKNHIIEFDEEIDIDFEKNNSESKIFEIAFNYKFLFDGLSIYKDEFIYFKYNSNNMPCSIQPILDNNTHYLILPMKI